MRTRVVRDSGCNQRIRWIAQLNRARRDRTCRHRLAKRRRHRRVDRHVGRPTGWAHTTHRRRRGVDYRERPREVGRQRIARYICHSTRSTYYRRRVGRAVRQRTARRQRRGLGRRVVGHRRGEHCVGGVPQLHGARRDRRGIQRLAKRRRHCCVERHVGRPTGWAYTTHHRRRGVQIEHCIDPVVRGIEGVGREPTGPIVIHPIARCHSTGQPMQRDVHILTIEIGAIKRIVSSWRIIRHDIGRVSRNRHRGRQTGLLPARRGLIGKGNAPQ